MVGRQSEEDQVTKQRCSRTLWCYYVFLKQSDTPETARSELSSTSIATTIAGTTTAIVTVVGTRYFEYLSERAVRRQVEAKSSIYVAQL